MFDNIMSAEELELANANTEEAEKLLEAASLQLMRYKPFYGVMLASMPIIRATETINTMATNGRDLFYSPEFVAGMCDKRKALVKQRIDQQITDKKKNAEMKLMIDVFYRRKTAREVALVLEHECDHVVSEHMYRGKGYNFALFNIAADHRINTNAILNHTTNSEMGTAWFPMGAKTVFDPDKEFGFMKWAYCDFQYADMYAEQIYELLVKNTPPPPPGGGGSAPGDGEKGDQKGDQSQQGNGPMGTDQHPNADGTFSEQDGEDDLSKAMGTDPGAMKPLTQEQKNYNDTVMRRAIENAVQAAGKGAPADARKFVEEAGKPKVNYLRLLRRTIERLFKDNVSYRRLNRRSYSLTRSLRQAGHLTSRQTIGLPSYTKAKTIRAHVFFDVSGSFTDDLLAPTKREIKGLCNQYEDFEVTMAAWSTKVGNICTYTKKNLKEIDNYKIKTTYGTDVQCVFECLDNLDKEPDQIVIYTDGYFSDVSNVKNWAEKYGKKTLWIILGRHGPEWTPPFGTAIDFDKYL
uniref:DUF2201 family putative metallopeptidase n=1 Tax=Escherichia coli TaxID=562 RepID=UPI003D3BA507